MAPETPKKEKELSESVKQLVKGYEYITGTFDFSKYAQDHSISLEAARKRFKRAFVANDLNVTTNVNNIVPGSTTPVSTPTKGFKRKTTDESTGSPSRETPVTKTPKSATKKVKADQKIEEEIAGDDVDTKE